MPKKIFNPQYISDRVANVAYNNNLDSHHINHMNSKMTMSSNPLDFGKNHANKRLEEMANKHARILNYYEFGYQIVFSARFNKEVKVDQVIDEIDLEISLNIIQKLTESTIDNIDRRSQL